MPIVPASPDPPPRRRRGSSVPVVPPERSPPPPPSAQRILEPYDGPGEIAASFSARYAMLFDLDQELALEHALDTLSRLIMARMSVDQCARTMGVTMVQVHKWRRLLRNRMVGAAKKVDIHALMGSFFEELDELRAQGWRDIQASHSVKTEPDGQGGHRQVAVVDLRRKQHGVNTVMRAQAQTMRVLDMTGALDSAPLRSAIETGDSSEGRTNALQQLAERFLSGGYQRGPVTVDGGEVETEGEDAEG